MSPPNRSSSGKSRPVLSVADSNPIRIVIAAEQSPFRNTLRGQLEREPGIQIVGEAPDSRVARELTGRLKPHILLIECALNREFAVGGNSSGLDTSVVVLVAAAEIQSIVEAFELGAKGVVLKSSLPRVWGVGIQAVLAGQYWVGDESVPILLQAARQFLLVRPESGSIGEFGLTPRELEIAGKIAAGLSNKEVGRQFLISERTVKHHLTNIFTKMGVSSRLELAVLLHDKNGFRPLALSKANSRS
jgi:two-component system nitrate/nitrite response regulator NarL